MATGDRAQPAWRWAAWASAFKDGRGEHLLLPGLRMVLTQSTCSTHWGRLYTSRRHQSAERLVNWCVFLRSVHIAPLYIVLINGIWLLASKWGEGGGGTRVGNLGSHLYSNLNPYVLIFKMNLKHLYW